jgi:hypothetical protein
VLVGTISFSRFAQAQEEIWGIRLACGHEEALKLGAKGDPASVKIERGFRLKKWGQLLAFKPRIGQRR